MSEINVEKGTFKSLRFEALDADTINYLKSILTPDFIQPPQDFHFSGQEALWSTVECDHFELEIRIGG